ncbi:hypothetical protein LJC63_04655 [Ruminococcaceae bacterium OttesenSCG-928-L11]|nr:hypothetical protein [Ruminococcaceae bacterium OttesenSCG-928-L11]
MNWTRLLLEIPAVDPTQASGAADALTEAEGSSGGTGIFLAFAGGIAIIVYGCMMLFGKREFLQNGRFFNRGKTVGDGALAMYRFTGIQMLIMGVLLILCGIGFLLMNAWLILIPAALLILLPIPFTIYRRNTKRFD